MPKESADNRLRRSDRETGPKTRIQEKNVAKILDAAVGIFAEHGFRGATVDRIATAAGMSKPNLHYYFKRKDDLYMAVLQRTLDAWLSPLEELNPDGEPAQELSRYISRKIEMSRTNPVESRMFANEILQGAPTLVGYLKTDLRSLVDRKAGTIRKWIAEGKMQEVDPYHLIFLIWASTQHYADFAPQVKAVVGVDSLGPKEFGEIEKSLCKIILNGVLPRV